MINLGEQAPARREDESLEAAAEFGLPVLRLYKVPRELLDLSFVRKGFGYVAVQQLLPHLQVQGLGFRVQGSGLGLRV